MSRVPSIAVTNTKYKDYASIFPGTTIILIAGVKNDHRSKFSNLSNWKEKPEKKNELFHILHIIILMTLLNRL